MPQQPQNTPIVQKPTPVVLDELLIETSDTNKALYDRQLEYGHLHPNRQLYPGYRFLKQEPTQYGQVRYYWGNDYVAQDAYNAAKTYALDANSAPIFTRSYRVLRSQYFIDGPTTKLTPFTGIVAVAVVTGGTGYTKDFAVTFTSISGTGGSATAIVDPATGAVIFITMNNVGVGYATAPTVVLSAGDGTGATAVAVIQPTTALLVSEEHEKLPQDDPYQSLYDKVTRTWETLPGPLISGAEIDELTGIVYPYSKQIVATNTVNSGRTGAQVVDLTINNPGSGFTAGTYNLVFTGGGGTGVTGTYTVTGPSPAGKIGTVTKTSGGAGYTSLPSASISGGGGSGATLSVALNGTPIASLTLGSSDSTFTDVPPVIISDSAGTGVGALGTATLTATGIDSVAVTAGGTGNTTGTITFPAPSGGAAATAHFTFSAGAVTGVVMDTPGSGYTSRPTFTVVLDGTGATFGPAILVATSVASVTLTATGNLYQNPLVSCSQGMANASVVALINPTSVKTVTLTAPGSGYSSPVVAFTGGGGSGAAATAALATGTITTATLTAGGTGYTSNPVITTPSGGGAGAVVVATIGSLTYTKVTPLSAVKDLVLRTSVNLASLPSKVTLPQSIRVVRSDVSSYSIIIAVGEARVDVGMAENSTIGGSGPVLAFRDEYYMTDSQFASFNPGGFSISGQYTTQTLNYTAQGAQAQVWTFRPTPNHQGTSAGVLEVNDQKKPYGIRFVSVLYVTTNY